MTRVIWCKYGCFLAFKLGAFKEIKEHEQNCPIKLQLLNRLQSCNHCKMFYLAHNPTVIPKFGLADNVSDAIYDIATFTQDLRIQFLLDEGIYQYDPWQQRSSPPSVTDHDRTSYQHPRLTIKVDQIYEVSCIRNVSTKEIILNIYRSNYEAPLRSIQAQIQTEAEIQLRNHRNTRGARIDKRSPKSSVDRDKRKRIPKSKPAKKKIKSNQRRPKLA